MVSITSPGWSLERQDLAVESPASDLVASDAATGADPLRDPGLVTIAGDWHAETAFATQVVRSAPPGPDGVRVILQLGDFSIWPGKAGQQFLDDVTATLEQLRAVLLFIDGNHEDHPQLAAFPTRDDGLRVIRPRLYHLARGFRWVWHGRRWLALGGAHSIDRPSRTAGADWWPGETLTTDEARRAAAGGPADYMITHDCPAGITMPGIKDPAPGQPKALYDELIAEAGHRRLLRDVVDTVRPRRLFHGHYHVRHDAELAMPDGTTCAVAGMGKTATLAGNAVVFDPRDETLTMLRPETNHG